MTYRIPCDEHVRKQTSVQLRKIEHDVDDFGAVESISEADGGQDGGGVGLG